MTRVRSRACLLISLALQGCATEAEHQEEAQRALYSKAVARLDSAIGQLEQVQTAVSSVISRRNITLVVPKLDVPDGSGSDSFAPSELVRGVAQRSQPSHVDIALVAFLKDAQDGAIIQSAYISGCRDYWSSNAEPEKSVANLAIYSEPIAAQLDAIVRIQFRPCAVTSEPLNSPIASLASDVNSKRIKSELDRARSEALNRSLQISPAERRAIVLGQTFRFASTSDKDIPVPPHVSFLFQEETARLARLYEPISARKFERFVFDRYVIPGSSTSIRNSQKGWFEALGIDGVVYVSPTFARAAVLACTSQTQSLPSLRARLIEERPRLLDWKITYADIRGLTETAERMVARVNGCIKAQATFLIAHELAHALLGLNEGHADCLAASMVRLSGKKEYGVFDTILFGALGTQFESALRLSSEGVALLKERQGQIAEFEAISASDATSILAACKKIEVSS